MRLKEKTSFPWLLSNVKDPKTKEPLGGCEDHKIVEHDGVKIGLIGLAEEEWLDCVPSFGEDEYEYESFVTVAKEWCKKFRDDGCELIIALTHMRIKNDKLLAEKVPDLDMILGGHDHFDDEININDVYILKSGTDFREFSIVKVELDCSKSMLNNEEEATVIDHDKRHMISREKVEITREFEPDQEMKEVVDHFWKDLKVQLQKIAGYTGVNMDATFATIRTQEAAISNF